MGFCLFNNVADRRLSRARACMGFERVAVMDFDVHHGNGTQAIFEQDAKLFYASTHQMPLYPGTGVDQRDGRGQYLQCAAAAHMPGRPSSARR